MKRKPRNPLIAQALFRRAGAHEKSEKAKRQNERVALARQLLKNQQKQIFSMDSPPPRETQ